MSWPDNIDNKMELGLSDGLVLIWLLLLELDCNLIFDWNMAIWFDLPNLLSFKPTAHVYQFTEDAALHGFNA